LCEYVDIVQKIVYERYVTLWLCHLHFKKNLKTKWRQNEEWWKLKYFTMQKYNLLKKKNPLKETKILSDIRTI